MVEFYESSGGPAPSTRVWLVNGEQVTVRARLDMVASALMRPPCPLVAFPLDADGREVVYVNGSQVTHLEVIPEAAAAPVDPPVLAAALAGR